MGPGLLGGCATTPDSTDTAAAKQINERESIRGSWNEETSLASTDRELEVQVLGSGETVVMLIASIHGDEPAGTPLLRRLVAMMQDDPSRFDDRLLVIVPVANPDGFESHRRTNSRGVDLNRNFPAANFTKRARHGNEPLSQWESRALHDLVLRWNPDRVVSFHQPVGCIDYDGPAKSLAEAMAQACDLPVKKIGARPGSLGSFVGLERGTPIITVELPGAAKRWSDDRIWDRYGEMLLAAIRY